MNNFIWGNKKYIWNLVKRDFQGANSGTILGKYWLLIDPLIYVFLTVFFFQQTMKGVDTLGVPYIAWVMPGILMWMYISTVINSSYNVFKEYSYLLRDPNFEYYVVVLIKILSALIIHLFSMSVMLIILTGLGYYEITGRLLLMPYYLLAITMVIFPIGVIVASITPFWPDFRNIFSIFMQIQFWLSPIFWDASKFEGLIGGIMAFNIFYFPIRGYRNALLDSELNYFDLELALLNIVFIAIMYNIGKIIYKRLRPGLGDIF